MLAVIRNLFKRNKSPGQLPLGRWARNHENVKSVYANSDHCGDIICGDPKKVKQIVNTQKQIKINLPQSNKLHTNTYKNQDFCCMLLGMNGPCEDCTMFPPGICATISPQVYMAQ